MLITPLIFATINRKLNFWDAVWNMEYYYKRIISVLNFLKVTQLTYLAARNWTLNSGLKIETCQGGQHNNPPDISNKRYPHDFIKSHYLC